MTITSPLDVPDCILWLDADALPLTDGDQVASWTDLSGNSNHATQTIPGQRPTWREAGIGERPALEFTRTQHDFMRLPGGIFDTGGGTTFAVGQVRTFSPGAGDFLLSAQQNGTGRERWRWYIWARPNTLWMSMGGITDSEDAPLSVTFPGQAGRPYLFAMRSDGAAQRFATRCPRSDEEASVPLSGAAARVAIGRINPDVNTQEWDGWIGEIIHYDRALNDVEWDDVIAYLADHWPLACTGWIVGGVGIG